MAGSITAKYTLSGKLSCNGGLTGKISVTKEYDVYTGKYEVVPHAFNAQILDTANRLLKENVVVTEVPYYEISNNSNGTTVYIAKGV